jgi:hypothetical protein
MKAYPACLLGGILLGAALLPGCGASAPPDPGTVTYSQVQAIFDSRCAGGGCHVDTVDPRILGGSLDLSASQAAPCTINIAAEQDPARVLVKPGNPGASYLLCKVDRSCAAIAGTWMPIGDTLSPDELAILRAWIQQGATGGATGSCGSPTPSGPDSVPPTFAGATGAAAGARSVQLSWSAATDNVSTQSQIVYLIYQAAAPGAENLATPSYTTTPGATSFTIGQLADSTKYYFIVRAQDQAGNIDVNKVEVSATTPAETIPPTFAGASSATGGSNSVMLQWSAATDNVSTAAQISYLIYQASAAGGESYATPTYTTAAGATSYTVANLNPGSTYYFVVRAKDAAGNIDTNTNEKSAMIAAVSFSGQIQPIFTASCTGAACHAGARPAQGLDLSSTAVSYSNLVNVLSSECTTTRRVLPSQPTMSYLMWKLQGSGPCFTGSQMPKGTPLSAAQINLISSWITAGAPNN